MSSIETSGQQNPADQVNKTEGFGAVLQRHRLEQGISLGDMEARSRLSVAQLRALESEDLDQLPEPVYVRAFIRGVAGVLEIDSAPLIADYAERFGGGVPAETVIPDHSLGREVVINNQDRRHGLKIFMLVILLVALAAGAWCFYTDQFGTRSAVLPAAQEPAATTPAADETPDTAKKKIESVDQALKEAATKAEQSDNPVARAADQTAQKLAAGGMTQNGRARDEAYEAKQAQEAAEAVKAKEREALEAKAAQERRARGIRQSIFTVTDPCWVQVTAPDGKRLLARVIKPGETVKLDTPRGTKVIVGKAAAMTFKVDGRTLDLQPHTQKAIARVTIK